MLEVARIAGPAITNRAVSTIPMFGKQLVVVTLAVLLHERYSAAKHERHCAQHERYSAAEPGN